jgi:heme exporter protein B
MSLPMRRQSPWRQFAVLFARDIRQEMASRDMLSSMGLYSLLVLVVFGAAFAQGLANPDMLAVSGGLVWVTLTFTSLLGLNRSFAAEREDAGLEGLLLAPLDRPVVFLAKAASNLTFLLAVEAVSCPVYYFLFLSGTTPTPSLPLAALPILVGSAGIAGVGTLLATITGSARGRDVLLAILFVPVAYPLLYAVASATSAAVTGGDIAGVFVPSLALAVAYDVIMVSVSWLLYDFVIST